MPLLQNAVLNKYLLGIVEAEWLDYFTHQKANADELKPQIAQTDSEIDVMVYELCGCGRRKCGLWRKENQKYKC